MLNTEDALNGNIDKTVHVPTKGGGLVTYARYRRKYGHRNGEVVWKTVLSIRKTFEWCRTAVPPRLQNTVGFLTHLLIKLCFGVGGKNPPSHLTPQDAAFWGLVLFVRRSPGGKLGVDCPNGKQIQRSEGMERIGCA
jgi:hypothetical protein